MKKLMIFIALVFVSLMITACEPTTTQISITTVATVCSVDASESATVCYTVVTKDPSTSYTGTDTVGTVDSDINATNVTGDVTKDTSSTSVNSSTVTTAGSGPSS